MSLSKRSIDVLLDLVEIKLSCMQVLDREDERELAALEASRRELIGMRSRPGAQRGRLPAQTQAA